MSPPVLSPYCVVVNIGLENAWPASDPNAPETAAKVARCATGYLGPGVVESWSVHSSDSEPTLVLVVHADVSVTRLYQLAKLLRQDAVAYYNAADDFGFLIGPKAGDWGDFDRSRFLLPDGSRAA